MIFILGLLVVVLCKGEWVPAMENPNLYEGDIELTPLQKQQMKRFGYASMKWVWPKKFQYLEIPYIIDQALSRNPSMVAAINSALSDYHKYTCIKFVDKKPHHKDYINFQTGFGCSSGMGYRTGKHSITLMAGSCKSKTVIMHEIGHTLGLFHEQSRTDRDDFVYISWSNIISYQKPQFKKAPAYRIDSRGTKFDYLSMMMYNQYAFSKKHGILPTIITKDARYQNLIGQRKGFSKIDVEQLNLMYPCHKKLSPPDPVEVKPVIKTVPTSITTTTEEIVCKEGASCKRFANTCHIEQTKKRCPITCKVC